MDKETFERLVEQVLSSLPAPYSEQLHNLVVIVEEKPDAETLTRVGFHNPDELLGFFDGIPRTERTFDQLDFGPARIHLFQASIEKEAALSELPLIRVIRETLWHEIAHYFGFTEDEMDRIEQLWAEQK